MICVFIVMSYNLKRIMSLSRILSFSLCILVTLHLVKCHISSLTNDEDPRFEPRCSRKCQNSDARSGEEDAMPLYMCSCSPSCATYGDCCYDSDYKNITSWRRKDFICLSVFGRGQYLAVSGCPPDQISDHCKSGIGHLPPVTSKMSNTTYANVFCAVCNGDADQLKTWNVELRCSSDNIDKNSTSANETIKIIYHFGYLWKYTASKKSRSLCMYHVHFDDFSLIDSLELRHCNHEEKVKDCSFSWKNVDVIKKCRLYEDPVYFGSKVYRNSHCAACNYISPKYASCMPFTMEVMLSMGIVDTEVVKYCRHRGSKSCVQYLSGKGRPYSFSSLLNIYQPECVPEAGQRCCSDERYDYRSKRCRKLVKDK